MLVPLLLKSPIDITSMIAIIPTDNEPIVDNVSTLPGKFLTKYLSNVPLGT